MMDGNQEPSTWWGTFSLAEGQVGRWRVGPCTVWIYHADHEWRVAHEQDDDPLDDTTDVNLPVPYEEAALSLEAPPSEATLSRFGFRQTDVHLRVMPMLADRPVVVRPEKLLYVPVGETATLYVSTPLWLSIEVGAEPQLLMELPSYRPSDTWFGPSTMEGELCYATRSMGRLRLEDLPQRLHRAITPVHLHNQADDVLHVERVRLPVGHLSLFQTDTHFLWTQAVTLERRKSDDMASLHLGLGAPPEAPGAVLLREPRETSKTNLIVRPFSMLFHKMKEV